MRRGGKSRREKKRYLFWRQCRQQSFELARRIFDWNLLDLQHTAHLSLDGAFFALEWLCDGFGTSALAWKPELEPLIEQLRRTPEVLLAGRTLLVQTLLLAGLAGASIRWLETRCHASTLAASEISEKDCRLRQLWRAYYAQAVRRQELIWLNVVDF